MEVLAVQPHQEQSRSFDIVASIDMLRFDLQANGRVVPETMQRVRDEELTYIAEGLNRPLYTEFVLRQVGGELSYFNRGKWQPYVGMLLRGLQVAEHEALQDSRTMFLAEQAVKDLQVGYRLAGLKPGEKHAWYADFPDEACERYGSRFVSERGFQVSRRMGFLYHAEKNADGSLTLRTQSVDASDKQAFEAAAAAADKNGDIVTMREAYDSVLMQKYGGVFHAGRRPNQLLNEENAWTTIERHQDILGYYFHEIEKLAGDVMLPRSELERAKKRLTYGVWSLLKERMGGQALAPSSYNRDNLRPTLYDEAWIREQVEQAYAETAKRGEILFGCGGILEGEEAILNASSEAVFDSIFGSKSDWGKMHCPFCKAEQWGDRCSPNQHCSKCDARVVGGKVKFKGNGGQQILRRNASRNHLVQKSLAKRLIIKADD